MALTPGTRLGVEGEGLDEKIDGFDRTRAHAPADAGKIRALRELLQRERVVSWFTTPSDLEARVSAAVTTAGLTSQLDLLEAAALPPGTGMAGDSAAEIGITRAIIAAGDHQRALKIDLVNPWWSTRLYLIAPAPRLPERLCPCGDAPLAGAWYPWPEDARGRG